MRLILFFLGFILTLQTAAQGNSAFFPNEFVVTANSLNLREAPDTRSKKLASLPQGTLVQFIEAWNDGQYTQTDTTDENSPYGRWLKVRSKNQTGWVFDAFVSSTIALQFEGLPQFDMKEVPPLFWYGVYARDSFSDELRKVQLRLTEVVNEFYGATFNVLKTDQRDSSKFLIGSHVALPTGYCGPLGMFDPHDMYFSRTLGPGNQLSIYPGNDLNDTLIKPTYGLAATGCANLEDGFVRITNYKLTLLNYSTDPFATQDLTPWVRTDYEESNPTVDLMWFGDLDQDGKPDAIIQDCPYETGCRASLLLSSRARPGEFLRKACEYFWPWD